MTSEIIQRARGSIRFALNTSTFTGAANLGQTGTTTTVFTATGRVLVLYIASFCTVLLDQSGASSSISLGTTNQVTRFIAATVVTGIDANEWWVSGTPTVGSIALPAACMDIVVSENIIYDFTGAANCNAGTLICGCWYLPLSANGALA